MTVPPCPTKGELVEAAIDLILTQYRESPNLLDLSRAVMAQVEEAAIAVCHIPDFFDLDTAVGDQLTLLGKRLGWPRCHCVCDIQPVFGFDCGTPFSYIPIVGFCDDNSTWLSCSPVGLGEICLNDDEVYRGFLRARRYQALGMYDIESLHNSIQHIWGETAYIADTRVGHIVVAPGRDLNDAELLQLSLAARVLPVAPGIAIKAHLGTDNVFGFGEGWGGFCDNPNESTIPYDPEVYDPSLSAIGEFSMGQGTKQDPTPRPTSIDSHWLCPIDAHPYDCAA